MGSYLEMASSTCQQESLVPSLCRLNVETPMKWHTSAAWKHLWHSLTLVQSFIWQLLIPVPIEGFLHCQELMGHVMYPRDTCLTPPPPSWHWHLITQRSSYLFWIIPVIWLLGEKLTVSVNFVIFTDSAGLNFHTQWCQYNSSNRCTLSWLN